MDESYAIEFKDVKLSEPQLDMFSKIVRFTHEGRTTNNVNVCEAVFWEIMKNTYDEKNNPKASGITKSELQDGRIKVHTRKMIGEGNYQSSVNDLSRKMCDDVIYILRGASLIYKGKRYHATERGMKVAGHLIKTSKGGKK